jgi:hypothetical protein
MKPHPIGGLPDGGSFNAVAARKAVVSPLCSVAVARVADAVYSTVPRMPNEAHNDEYPQLCPFWKVTRVFILLSLRYDIFAVD